MLHDGDARSALASLHDFFSGPVGLLFLSMIGLAGLLLAYLATKDRGRPRAGMIVSCAAVAGVLGTFATRSVSTTVRKDYVETRTRAWPAHEVRLGLPAYSRTDWAQGDGPHEIDRHDGALLVDGLFWSGCAGLVLALVALRRRAA